MAKCDFCWLKIWFVGNGGMRGCEQYVFVHKSFKDYDREDQAATVERYLGPLPSSARSVNWEYEDPPNKEAVLLHQEAVAEQERLTARIRSLLQIMAKG